MENNLKELTIVDGMMEAEILKSKLESFGIPSMLQFETAGRLLGISMDGLGKVKIMVNAKDYDRARDTLDSKDE